MLPPFSCPKMHAATLARTRWLPTPGPLELQRYKRYDFLSAEVEVWHFYCGPWIICSYLGPGVMDANISLHVLLDRRSLLYTVHITMHLYFECMQITIIHASVDMTYLNGACTWTLCMHISLVYVCSYISECMSITWFLPLKYELTSLSVHNTIDACVHICTDMSVTCISVHVTVSPVGLAGYGLAAGKVAEQT